MFRFDQSKPVMKNVALILLGLFITTLGQPSIPVATARDARGEGRTVNRTSDAPATAVWISCTPIGVVVYAGREHVQCLESFSGISYFAVSTADPSHAARVLSVISTAQVAGRVVSILYDPADTSGAAIGCQPSSCRLILGVGFGL